jgi:hypothetical protein
MKNKLELRSAIETLTFENTTAIEKFQNETLRPVLKLQNEVYLLVFENYAINLNIHFKTLSTENKWKLIEQSIQKDVALKNILIGVTIGMLTKEELINYLLESKTYNKRIITMLVERFKSQIK